MLSAPDREIWSKALAIDAALITKDADFITLRAVHRDGPAIVWVRIGNASAKALLQRIESALSDMLAALDRGEHIVVVA